MIHPNSDLSYDEHKKSGKRDAWRKKAYEYLFVQGAKSDREIINALEVEDVNNIRPEITRMIQEGILQECGKKICQFTGKRVRLSEVSAPYRGRNAQTEVSVST